MRTSVIIAVALLLIGFMGMTSTHYIPPASYFSTSLQQNLNYTLKGYNSFGGQVFTVNTQLYPMNGTFEYSNNPIVISSWTINGESSAFSATVHVSGWTSDYVAVYVNDTFNVLLMNTTTGQWSTIYSDYTTQYFQAGGGFAEYPFNGYLTSGIIRVNGPYQGILEVQVEETIATTSEAFIGSYHKTPTLFTQSYLVPGSGTINTAPQVVQEGGKVYIYGQVNFGHYYVQVYGSQGYNGGAMVANYTIQGENTFYNFTYTVPSNAFVSSSNPEENMWTVELWNSLLAQHVQQFFTVDHLNLIPPAPKITITNTPTSGVFTTGQTVDVSVNAPNNKNSTSPVTSIIVWVYYDEGGEPAPGSSLWIIDQQIYPVQNGQSAFTFQIGSLVQSITIKVVSVDSSGRASNASYYTIQAQSITTGGGHGLGAEAQLITYAVMGVSIIIGELVIMFNRGWSMVDKAIVSAGFLGMMAMLYIPISMFIAHQVAGLPTAQIILLR